VSYRTLASRGIIFSALPGFWRFGRHARAQIKNLAARRACGVRPARIRARRAIEIFKA